MFQVSATIDANGASILQDPTPVFLCRFPPPSRLWKRLKFSELRGLSSKAVGKALCTLIFLRSSLMADALGFEIGLITHGGNLTPPIVNAAAEACDYVRISVDGPTPESRKDIHGVNDLEDVIEGAGNLLSRRGSRRHPIIGLTFCIDYGRRHLIRKCLELGEIIKPDYVLIRPPFCEEVGFQSPHSSEEGCDAQRRDTVYSRRISGRHPCNGRGMDR